MTDAIRPRFRPRPVPTSYRADYKAMQRFGLSESNLPAGTTVLFKEPTHLGCSIAISCSPRFAVIGLQSAFAGALLLERRSRTRAEAC